MSASSLLILSGISDAGQALAFYKDRISLKILSFPTQENKKFVVFLNISPILSVLGCFYIQLFPSGLGHSFHLQEDCSCYTQLL